MAKACGLHIPRPKDQTLLYYLNPSAARAESPDTQLPTEGSGFCASRAIHWAFMRYMVADGLPMLFFVVLVDTLFAWLIGKLAAVGHNVWGCAAHANGWWELSLKLHAAAANHPRLPPPLLRCRWGAAA